MNDEQFQKIFDVLSSMKTDITIIRSLAIFAIGISVGRYIGSFVEYFLK